MQTNSQLLDLSGKTAIVTGGALGIGFGIASRLAEAGATVIIANRNAEDGNKAVRELVDQGRKAMFSQLDVSIEDSVKRLMEETVGMHGAIDILVNNAGIYPNVPVMSMTLEDFEKVLDTNLRGVFLCTKYAAEKMIQRGQGGRIINITSIDALHPSTVGLAHYDASKHGAWGFTKNVALELAPHEIWVNAIAPGAINTPGVQNSQQGGQTGDIQKVIEAFLAKIPMHRMGEADEIGKAALFLASDMSSYMTGSQIVVDGGALLS